MATAGASIASTVLVADGTSLAIATAAFMERIMDTNAQSARATMTGPTADLPQLTPMHRHLMDALPLLMPQQSMAVRVMVVANITRT
jgi:hypothetical protein